VLAFWDKDDKADTLELATNGFYRKTQKTPSKEINKAIRIKREYFDLKRRK